MIMIISRLESMIISFIFLMSYGHLKIGYKGLWPDFGANLKIYKKIQF